ncbi:MAG: hypothetical protein IPG78_03915 [Ignavibacteria bacterium]|nr:hypothetical protein [Ignavibacteria bacterium]
MDKFLLGKAFTEHHKYPNGEFISESILKNLPEPILFLGKKDAICVEIKENRMLHTIYYIGVDWINNEVPIYVEPKLNENTKETDFLTMLFSALNHPEIAEYCDELFEIKFHDTQIEINQQQDKLTPLLIVLFIRLVQEIVRKGLKKSYYRVEKNLNSRIKGKILVSRTIKDNIIKIKCSRLIAVLMSLDIMDTKTDC